MESILELSNKCFESELSNRTSDLSSSDDSERSVSETEGTIREQRYLKWLKARRKNLNLGVFVFYPRCGYG
jgi:hypothetical protein